MSENLLLIYVFICTWGPQRLSSRTFSHFLLVRKYLVSQFPSSSPSNMSLSQLMDSFSFILVLSIVCLFVFLFILTPFVWTHDFHTERDLRDFWIYLVIPGFYQLSPIFLFDHMAYSPPHQSSAVATGVLWMLTTHSMKRKIKSPDLWHLPIFVADIFPPWSISRMTCLTASCQSRWNFHPLFCDLTHSHRFQHVTGSNQLEWENS